MLTKQEVIDKYGISNQTIKRRTKEGLLHPVIKARKCYYDEQELECVFGNKKSPHELFIEEVYNHYGYHPYTYIEEYKSNFEKMKLICNKCGNNIEVSPGNIKNNMRKNIDPVCKYCMANRLAESKRRDVDSYIEELSSLSNNSYTLLGEFIDIQTKTLHKCNICNYEWEIQPNNILYCLKSGKTRPCPKCNNMIRDERSYEERLAEANPTIVNIEPYKGRKTPINHKCLVCNHLWSSIPDNRLRGEGCPKCANTITQSKAELAIIDYIESLDMKVETKNRKILEGKEIDILIPDKNIGIEVNGNYWHSEKYKGKKYHIGKTILAESKGLRLIQIFDDEWNEHEDIVKSKIRHILGIDSNLQRIYARKCTIKEIDVKVKNEFLNNNHIQGADRSDIKLGLYYEDILMSVMTFAKPRISMGSGGQKIAYDYELSRFASNISYIVVGGFSKLFKYFERNYKWGNIISYADRRWSIGNLYEINGWINLHSTTANYWYVNKNTKKRYHRYTFRKQAIKDKFPEIFDPNKTEFEMMDQTEYFRLWDCGNIAYQYKRK